MQVGNIVYEIGNSCNAVNFPKKRARIRNSFWSTNLNDCFNEYANYAQNKLSYPNMYPCFFGPVLRFFDSSANWNFKLTLTSLLSSLHVCVVHQLLYCFFCIRTYSILVSFQQLGKRDIFVILVGFQCHFSLRCSRSQNSLAVVKSVFQRDL